MRPTNSTLLGMISISLVAASFQLCAMSDTDPTLLGLVGTSLVPASFNFCALCGDTDSSLHGLLVHPLWLQRFVLAPLRLGAMRNADSSLNNYIGISLKDALSPRAMCYTNSSLHDLLCTSLEVYRFVIAPCL